MKINTKVFSKLISYFLVAKARNAQSTQNNKLRYFPTRTHEEMVKKISFVHKHIIVKSV